MFVFIVSSVLVYPNNPKPLQMAYCNNLWFFFQGTHRVEHRIQGFESVGKSNFAYNSSVTLVHNSYIYVTVIACNTAGQTAVTYSTPILVDLTPANITGVYDGRIIGNYFRIFIVCINIG